MSVTSTNANARRPTTTPEPDPLQTQQNNGLVLGGVDESDFLPELQRALADGADVPGRVQDGPTCGLYALGMVMDYWDKKSSANLNPLVRAEDFDRPSAYNRPPDTDALLFEVAKDRGYTTQGEMFYANELAALATEFGYEARVTENLTLEDIKACVDRGHPALIGFDVDDSGDPGLSDGYRAHWAVIEGHFEKDGVEYLVATHGWTGEEYVWRAEDFMASVNQVNHSDFEAAPSDITGTLRARLVEVVPAGE
jgi:hypothetical protein